MDKILKYPEDYIDRIICGDCLEVMKRIPDNSIDLVLTDPPFNAGKDFANDNLKLSDYFVWLNSVCVCLQRVMKNNSALLTECSKKYLPDFLDILRSYFNFEHQIINHCTNDIRRGKMGWSKYSIILWFSKGHRKNNYCIGDLIKTTIVSNRHLFRHPSPKSISCYYKLIHWFSNKNNIVLDPFLGSGTTAIACKQLDRHYIGIDIKEEYCEIARKRVKEARYTPTFNYMKVPEKQPEQQELKGIQNEAE